MQASALVLRLWRITVGLNLIIPALSPAATSFQDYSFDLKTSRINKVKQDTLIQSTHSDKVVLNQRKLLSYRGPSNHRGGSANQSLAATLPQIM